MLSYEEAKQMMERARHGRRKLENNTWLEERGPGQRDDCLGFKEPFYAVRLHDTDVVTLHPDGSYTLNSGGWRTVTTKDRINHYAPGALFSNRGAWMVTGTKKKLEAWDSHGGGFSWDFDAAVPFADGMRVFPDGRVEGAGVDETAIRNALLKQIRAYVDGFARHVAKHGLADPSGEDCWGCCMVDANAKPGSGRAPWGQDKATKPGADHIMGVGHILEHFKDRYYVPSLVWRAVQRCGNPGWAYVMIQRDAQHTHPDTRFLKRQLRAYFKALMPALVAAKVAELERRAA